MAVRSYRAGDSLEDFCRACKTDRMHVVVAADNDGQPIRVVCGFCRSEHNYRGGPRVDASAPAAAAPGSAARRERGPAPTREPFPIVSERERIAPPMTDLSGQDLEMLLRRIIREETGISPVPPAEKWRNGTLVLRPGT